MRSDTSDGEHRLFVIDGLQPWHGGRSRNSDGEGSTPRISVVIPCRNEGATLAACLDALDAQDAPPGSFEVIIVDGASVDGCGEFARARGHRVLADPCRGPGAARNVGIAQARGRTIAFTDADCVPRHDWLSRLTAPLENGERVAGVAGGMRMTRATLAGRVEDDRSHASYAGYITSNIAYRRDVLLEMGGFDESLHCAEDFDLAWRVLDAGHEIARAPDAIVLHDQPEVRAGLGPYLARQFWYARNDVAAFARALARADVGRPGARRARRSMAASLRRAALVGVGLASVALHAPAFAFGAWGALAVPAAREVIRSASLTGAPRDELGRMIALETTRCAVRGAGTLVGLIETSLRRQGLPRHASAEVVASEQWARAAI